MSDVSRRVASGTAITKFIGWSKTCYACLRSFRTFRKTETHCGCCDHLKDRMQ